MFQSKEALGQEETQVRAKYSSQSSSSEEDQSSVHEHLQDSTDPVFYREVDMSDLPSQYAEEVDSLTP